MNISQIQLRNFRLFKEKFVSLSPQITLIVGNNTLGKTSLLESIYTGIYGTGFRETRENQLIQWEESQAIVEWKGGIEKAVSLQQISLTKQEQNRVQKKYYINKTKQSFNTFRKQGWNAVLFAPEEIRIISGSQSRRRVYFDTVLSKTDPTYRRYIRQYKTALRKRNKVFETVFEVSDLKKQLAYWNEYLIVRAQYLSKQREKYISFLHEHSELNNKSFLVEHRNHVLSEEAFERVFSQEIRIRRTLIGPHKDEYNFYLTTPIKKDVGMYGSRSEQRMTLLWLTLIEITYLESLTSTKPILLLDDIFSELDVEHKDVVANLVDQYQTIITSTRDNLGEIDYSAWEVVELV